MLYANIVRGVIRCPFTCSLEILSPHTPNPPLPRLQKNLKKILVTLKQNKRKSFNYITTMLRKAAVLAARQRITSCNQRRTHLNYVDTEVEAGCTSGTRPHILDLNNTTMEDVEEDTGYMTTYSTFDPYSSRPLSLPLQSGIVTALPTPSSQPTSSQSETEKNTEMQNEEKHESGNGKAPSKPYPYSSLPSHLETKLSPTCPIMNPTADTTTTNHTAAQSKRIGVFHAILYGVPDPERFSYTREMVAPGSFLHKIMYGVKEMDGGEGVVVVAGTTTVQSEDKATEVVVVKDVQVSVDVEDVLEKDDGQGQGMMAK
jgi:hypothetical protein